MSTASKRWIRAVWLAPLTRAPQGTSGNTAAISCYNNRTTQSLYIDSPALDTSLSLSRPEIRNYFRDWNNKYPFLQTQWPTFLCASTVYSLSFFVFFKKSVHFLSHSALKIVSHYFFIPVYVYPLFRMLMVCSKSFLIKKFVSEGIPDVEWMCLRLKTLRILLW